MIQILVIMGVSGSGKTTVGQALAAHLGCAYYDGDDFHPPQNVAKMSAGVPLSDDDRAPWLSRLSSLIAEHLQRGETAVIACSALKKSYRDQLRGRNDVRFVFLDGDFDLIWERLQNRENHYMKAEMLRSQFDTLEVPGEDEAIRVSVEQDVASMIRVIQQALKKRNRAGV